MIECNRDSINPKCPTNDGIETREHFLLLCPSFEAERRNLLTRVFQLLRPYGYIDLSNEVLAQLLLYGDRYLPNDLNRNILELTLQYIHANVRFKITLELVNRHLTTKSIFVKFLVAESRPVSLVRPFHISFFRLT